MIMPMAASPWPRNFPSLRLIWRKAMNPTITPATALKPRVQNARKLRTKAANASPLTLGRGKSLAPGRASRGGGGPGRAGKGGGNAGEAEVEVSWNAAASSGNCLNVFHSADPSTCTSVLRSTCRRPIHCRKMSALIGPISLPSGPRILNMIDDACASCAGKPTKSIRKNALPRLDARFGFGVLLPLLEAASRDLSLCPLQENAPFAAAWCVQFNLHDARGTELSRWATTGTILRSRNAEFVPRPVIRRLGTTPKKSNFSGDFGLRGVRTTGE